MLQYNYIVQCNPLNWSVSAWPLFTFIQQSWKACSNHIYWLQSVNHWSNLSSHTRPSSFTAILSEKVSAADPLSSVLDDVVRLDKILSTDGGVLIIDQICLVIPDPRRFPDILSFNQTVTLCPYGLYYDAELSFFLILSPRHRSVGRPPLLSRRPSQVMLLPSLTSSESRSLSFTPDKGAYMAHTLMPLITLS